MRTIHNVEAQRAIGEFSLQFAGDFTKSEIDGNRCKRPSFIRHSLLRRANKFSLEENEGIIYDPSRTTGATTRRNSNRRNKWQNNKKSG